MIDSVRAETFGMHRKIVCKHLHNINLLLGINGTGKTFILKAMYVAMRTVEDKPLLTGGALKKAMDLVTEDAVFVLNGDTFFGVDLSQMMNFHRRSHSDATLAVKELHNFSRYGTVLFDDTHRITRFIEKRACQRGFINGGVYVLNRTLFDEVHQSKFMMEKDFLEKYVESKVFYAFTGAGYFIDIGIPEDYQKANEEFDKLV